jgi:hypothetical protein
MKFKPLQVKEVPVELGARHPDTPSEILPNHEFSMALIAPKGSGKTTLLCNLLNFYKGYFNTIIIFSPTYKNDDKWKWVKKQKFLVENKALKKFLKKMQEKRKDQESIVGPPPTKTNSNLMVGKEVVQKPRKLEDDEKFDGRIPDDCFIAEYSHALLQDIMAQQQAMVDLLESEGLSKHVANRILFLFDDLVGSETYSAASQNPFKKLSTNHRHLSCSILEVSQAYKEIQKTVRTQVTCLILFKIYNKKEIDVIKEEYPMGMENDQWDKVYQYCVSGEYNFLFFDIQKPDGMKVMKNFEEFLYFK